MPDRAAEFASALAAWAWQASVHSAICGFICYVWVHRVELPSGRAKRRLLAVVLALPVVTAAVPGRSAIEFGERIAVFNSARLLAIPLGGSLMAWHVALVCGAAITAITLWQEVWPAFRRPISSREGVPGDLVARARALPGWEACEVRLSPSSGVVLATGGRPGRMHLIVSRGALDRLDRDQLDAALAHEHAHWRDGRWFVHHGLFVVRLMQAFNPVAMWVFREYSIEVEIGCDADAVAGRRPGTLARVLLTVYDGTSRRDPAARAAIRKRVDVLLAGGPVDVPVPCATVNAVGVLMLLVLPWVA